MPHQILTLALIQGNAYFFINLMRIQSPSTGATITGTERHALKPADGH
jgi:hypothetical protein